MFSAVFVSARISASRRNCATANGPNWSSKPNSRFAAARSRRAPRLRPDPSRHWRRFAAGAEQERAGADRRIGERDVRRGEPRRPLEQRPAQSLIDEVHHRLDHFRRGVVRAGELAQPVVVHFEKMLVEIEPGFRLVLAEGVPVHFVQHARQRVERGLQRLLIGLVLRQRLSAVPISVLICPA